MNIILLFIQFLSPIRFGQWSICNPVFISFFYGKTVRNVYLKSPAETYTFILICLHFEIQRRAAKPFVSLSLSLFSILILLSFFLDGMDDFHVLFNNHWTELNCNGIHIFVCMCFVILIACCSNKQSSAYSAQVIHDWGAMWGCVFEHAILIHPCNHSL